MTSSLAALVLVFGLLGGLLVLLRRWGPRRQQGRWLEVLEDVPLGTGRHLTLVRAGTRRLLLASTQKRVTLVGEVAEEGTELKPGGSEPTRSNPEASPGKAKAQWATPAG